MAEPHPQREVAINGKELNELPEAEILIEPNDAGCSNTTTTTTKAECAVKLDPNRGIHPAYWRPKKVLRYLDEDSE